MSTVKSCLVMSPDWQGQKTELEIIQKLFSGLIALDQVAYNQDWSIVKHSNVLQCAVCSAAWRIVRGCPWGCRGFEKVGILERKQMAHIKSKGPLWLSSMALQRTGKLNEKFNQIPQIKCPAG